MKLKMFCLIAVLLAALPLAAYGEHYVELESGTVYVQADGNTWTSRTAIPITQAYSRLRVTPRPDPDGAGTTVVGRWDFRVSDTATGDYEYQYFSQTYVPYVRTVGNATAWTNVKLVAAYLSDTTTATYSGEACGVGQWYEWVTELIIE